MLCFDVAREPEGVRGRRGPSGENAGDSESGGRSPGSLAWLAGGRASERAIQQASDLSAFVRCVLERPTTPRPLDVPVVVAPSPPPLPPMVVAVVVVVAVAVVAA